MREVKGWSRRLLDTGLPMWEVEHGDRSIYLSADGFICGGSGHTPVAIVEDLVHAWNEYKQSRALPDNPSTLQIRDWVQNHGGLNVIVSRLEKDFVRVDVCGMTAAQMSVLEKELVAASGLRVQVCERGDR
jgi:hypothetical protein